MKKKSQTQRILDWLQAGRKLTAIQALNKFGCFRLAARINDLRDDGLQIKSETVKQGGKTYARYFV